MSISKLFTSIFAMFAIFGTNAFAAPSIRQIGVSTSTATTGTAKPAESNTERAATTVAVKPAAKPAATTSTTTTSDDTARLVGVPFVVGKTSHSNKQNNSKTSSATASTELNSLREQLESLQNDFVALATQNYVDQQLANIRTEAAQAIVEAKNNMVSQEVLTQTVDNAVRDLASNETISNAMDTKIANLANQVDTKLSKKIEQPQLTSAISDAVGNLASNDTIVTLKNRVDGHDTELAKAVKKDDTTYLDSYVTTKNLASKNDITNTLGDLKFTVDQNAKQVKFSVGNDSTQHKFADIADLGGTPGCSSSVSTEPDSVNRQMKVTTTNSCTNETDTKYIPYGENAKEITIEVDDGAIKWKRDGESSHKIVDMADLKGQDAKEISIEVDDGAIKWKREGGNAQKLVDIADLKGQDAKEVSIEVVDGAIKWKRDGESSHKIVDMADLKGEDAKVPAFKIEGENLMYKADKDSGAEFVTLGKVKGDKGQDGEGLTAQDREDIEAVKTVGTYFTNGSLPIEKVTGLQNALASKLTSSDLADYAKSTDVSSNIATAKQEAINSAKTEALNAVAAEYAKSTDVSSNIATAKQEAINSAKTEALNAVASEYAKSTDVSSSIATAKQEAINSAKTEAQQYADRTFATTQTVQNLKVSDLDGSDKLVQKSDKLDAVMGKFDDSGNLSEGFKTEVANAVSDKGFVTETNLNAKLGETASFQQMYNALSSKGLITKTESGEIVATDETPGN
ncbi:MAG: hypothetical protein J6W27_03590 [Alphaproteobacteria bacterium]|nr:hypothetical protein [Alphaproteobacteria bacterium]